MGAGQVSVTVTSALAAPVRLRSSTQCCAPHARLPGMPAATLTLSPFSVSARAAPLVSHVPLLRGLRAGSGQRLPMVDGTAAGGFGALATLPVPSRHLASGRTLLTQSTPL